MRDAIDRVTEALTAIAQATAWAAAATLLTGFVVLIGAAAAGERARVYEAAVLKTLGATRGRILLSFALRSALLGAAAGVVAIIAGGLAGWAVMRFVMEATMRSSRSRRWPSCWAGCSPRCWPAWPLPGDRWRPARHRCCGRRSSGPFGER